MIYLVETVCKSSQLELVYHRNARLFVHIVFYYADFLCFTYVLHLSLLTCHEIEWMNTVMKSN